MSDVRMVPVDSPAEGPPLILTSERRLRPEDVANLRRSWEAAWRGDHPGPGPRILVLDAGLELYQLIDGEWRPLGDADVSALSQALLDGPGDPPPAV